MDEQDEERVSRKAAKHAKLKHEEGDRAFEYRFRVNGTQWHTLAHILRNIFVSFYL
jgi:hypothetical protein